MKLPPSIEDLIPTNTVITSPATKVDSNGNCLFNVSLVYYVSFKQLQRLKRSDAKTTLSLVKINHDATTEKDKNDQLLFSISDAKEVLYQSQHKLDYIYNFVADKGAWYTIQKTRQQLKVGLFYVAMPDNNNNFSSNSSMISNSPSIQLRSPPPTPIIPKRMNQSSTSRKKKLTSILGTPSLLLNTSTTSHRTTPSTTPTKKQTTPTYKTEEKRIPLRRTKSSLVDLNIEELADVLKKINIFSNEPTTPPVPAIPKQHQQQPHHQIGNGTLQYTLYFKIMYSEHLDLPLLKKQQSTTLTTKRMTKRPFFSYTFLTDYNLIPAASMNQNTKHSAKSCFQLRGHLVEIQNWLNNKETIDLNYIVMDKYTKETLGISKIPLKGIAFESKGIVDKIYPVYDIKTNEKEIANVTVRIGLVHGWHMDGHHTLDNLVMDNKPHQPKRSTQTKQVVDPWDVIVENKKKRHLSQSSVPTLLTSSTTSSTKSSTQHPIIPTIQYIQHTRPSLKKSTYSYKPLT